MSHDLTRWIEVAEARRFGETAMLDQRRQSEHHDMHLGAVMAHLPGWLRQAVSGEMLAAIACHARALRE